MDEFEFDPRRKARRYSKGNRPKVALIAAFARPARLYLLDEPTSGLDPLMDSVFRRHIHRVSGGGATVLLSSHILREVEQLCSGVTIIRSGRAVEAGSLAELRHLKLIHFRVQGGDAVPIAALPGIQGVVTDRDTIEFDVNAANLAPVLKAVATAGASGLSVSPPSLESLFLSHYNNSTGQVP